MRGQGGGSRVVTPVLRFIRLCRSPVLLLMFLMEFILFSPGVQVPIVLPLQNHVLPWHRDGAEELRSRSNVLLISMNPNRDAPVRSLPYLVFKAR